MFRTTKCSSSVGLYKQLYGILSCIYISSLVADRMCQQLQCLYRFIQHFNPLLHTTSCETGWAIDAFAVNSSFLSVDGITCLIPFESWRNDLSNGISYILYQFLGYKSIFNHFVRKKLVFKWANYQLMHTTLKNVELLKHFKISKTAPTCFSLQGNHHQGATVST